MRYIKKENGTYEKYITIPKEGMDVYLFKQVNIFIPLANNQIEDYKDKDLYYETGEVEYVEI
jgi:hypothetical protein